VNKARLVQAADRDRAVVVVRNHPA
jgi:hypothetical protein